MQTLPRELSSFVGRETELRQVELHLDAAPLVTLAGPGGAGKTRLALQLARRLTTANSFADGVLVVELASLSEPRAVARAVAERIGAADQTGEAIADMLMRVLRTQQRLLVLDNCEHLLAACAELAEHLLRGCPQLRMLATSREPLSIAGEIVYRVPPLGLPMDDGLAALVESEAGRLFVQRAQAANPAFALVETNAPAVAEICRRLDGLPLAIELAAARVAAFAPSDIASRLGDAFHLLSSGARTALPRQQTLEAAMAWSYELLDEPERLLFERLSVFGGGFTLEGAQAMAGSDDGIDALAILPRLVAKSMVQADPRADGSMRYRLLEPLRQFALARLTHSGALGRARRRHALHLLTIAERANRDPNLPSLAVYSRELNAESENFRSALDWAEEVGDAELGVRLGAALWFWWSRPDRQTEGRVWLERARSIPGAEAYPVIRAKVTAGLALLTVAQGDPVPGRRNAFDAKAVADAYNDPWLASMSRAVLGLATAQLGDLDAAEAWLQDSLERAQRADLRWIEARNLETLGLMAVGRADMATAESLLRRALQLARARLDPWSQGMALNSLADYLRASGDAEHAAPAYQEALELFQTLDIPRYLPQGLIHNLGYIALAEGDVLRAARLFFESADVYRTVGNDRRGLSECVIGLACTAVKCGQPELAAHLFGSAEATLEQLRMVLTPANHVEFERGLTALAEIMDPRRMAAERDAGRALALEEAIAEAREPLLRPVPSMSMPGRPPAGLTTREFEVAVLLARGMSNRQVAEELVITEKTAKNHVQRVLDKLGVRSRAQVASRADELGLRI